VLSLKGVEGFSSRVVVEMQDWDSKDRTLTSNREHINQNVDTTQGGALSFLY
jgi:hypothetical protein